LRVEGCRSPGDPRGVAPHRDPAPPHVLAQAELWYEDMTLMAGAISSSEYERQVNDLINYVATASNGQRTKAAVYRKFAAWRVNVVELWLDTAIKTGMLIDTGSHLVMRGREND